MVKRNHNIAKLNAGYLFPEINKRKQAFLKKNPQADLISLGIGDTTQPLSTYLTKAIQKNVASMSSCEGYSGYGPEQGQPELRQKIAEVVYGNTVKAEEIFVSDGAKCDIGRLQILFGSEVSIAVQDPTYPVYVDSGVMLGQTQGYNAVTGQYGNITYMPCNPENNFFPDLKNTARTDIIYFCSPNNPTGSVATQKQLEELVAFAKKNRSILVFDAAYAAYISDPTLPKSIFEIAGAREVAIEVNSFSKMAGFTGLRLGWSVVPAELCYEDGSPVRKDWERIQTTIFNGASNIIQRAGLAVLEEKGLATIKTMVDYYMENATIMRQACLALDMEVYGGLQAPYLWVNFPNKKSWEMFEHLLEHAHLITTPGSGFGQAGEGFLRFSAFGHRNDVLEAMKRLEGIFVFQR